MAIRPILSKTFNSREQVDLINMKNQKYGDFKFILIYQVYFTKYTYFFTTVKNNTAGEVHTVL